MAIGIRSTDDTNGNSGRPFTAREPARKPAGMAKIAIFSVLMANKGAIATAKTQGTTVHWNSGL
tara:strand:- start:2840 stop:3031 length:192 start_codon:yes stop_codon:yes gene_type:complete